MLKKLSGVLLSVIITVAVALSCISTVYAKTALKITKQPVSVTVSANATAKTTVKVKGDGLKYKWYYKNPGGKKFAVTSSFKGNSYSIKMNKDRSGRQVYCVITDKYGSSVKTNTVTLSMKTPLKITKQPTSVVALNGKTAKVSFSVNGDGLKYKWYYKNPSSKKFATTSSFKSNSYSLKMNKDRSGRQVYCVITDKYGSSVKTNTVTLSMKTPLKITQQPSSVTVLNGVTAKVTVKANGDGLKYKWYYKNSSASSFSVDTSFSGSSYSATMSKSVNGRQVYCVITDKYGDSAKTNTVTLSLKTPLKITEQPASVTVLNGAAAKVTVKANGDGLKYKWYYKNSSASSFSVDTSFSGSSYSATMSKSVNGRQVYCVITDKYGDSAKTNTVTLILKTPLKITKQPSSVVASDASQVKISLSATGDELKYKWYYKNTSASSFSAAAAFTGNSYSVTMSKDVSGRQVYCEITDKYGDSIKTNTVTLNMGTPLAITRQPFSVSVIKEGDVKITFEAEGESLTYKWYYKDADSSKFTSTSTFTSSYYTTTMTSARDGRQIYCVVSDKFGNSVKTNVVTMKIGTPVLISLQPASTTVAYGETASLLIGVAGDTVTYEWYYKNAGESRVVLASDFTEASYCVEMTDSVNGRQVYCIVTDSNGFSVQSDTAVLTMGPSYTISISTGYGEPETVGVMRDGKYSLSDPSRPGYNFKGWQTIAGNDFASSGTIQEDVSVKAVWEVDKTETLEELVERANAGATEIIIADDIVVNQPIYISHDVTIYSDKDCTLKRDPDYFGDMFVVGVDAKGETAVLQHRKAILTLGSGTGTLTIDGNRDNMKVDVVGSAIFAADSATVNIKDGVVIRNNRKVGNERLMTYAVSSTEDGLKRVGGAAIIAHNADLNMYGGVIENNAVLTDYTIVTDASGNETKDAIAACGGAIFSNGSFNMYGGTIKNNEALRGGAIHCACPTNLIAGTIHGNTAYEFAGAISAQGHMHTNIYLGSEDGTDALYITDNYAKLVGGAITAGTVNPIVVLGNTVFEGNHSDGSGGAIYTSGSLIVKGATFLSNYSEASGGAVYFHNSKDSTWEPRDADFKDCTFEGNSAGLGGAIVFSRTNGADEKSEGVMATIEDCKFIENQAVKTASSDGLGGALYITQKAELVVSGCEFTENSSAYGGGAVSVHNEAKADISDCTFSKNTAVEGGAMYLDPNSVAELKELTFSENEAVLSQAGTGGLGGAISCYSKSITADKLNLCNNSADNNGGAINLVATTLTLGADNRVEGNTAGGHGGAFYLTYSNNSDGTTTGSELILNDIEIKGNTANNGGAISVRSDCKATLNGARLTDNVALSAQSESMGGGAIYVGHGKLELTDTTLDGNKSAYYGGAISSRNSEVTISGGTVENSEGETGGALYFFAESTVNLTDLTVENNKATSNGVIYANSSVVDMTNVTASGNIADCGGVLYTSGTSTSVTVKDSTWSDNSAALGGAVYMSDASVTLTNCTMSNNSAQLGGAVYNLRGTLATEGVTFTENSAAKNTEDANGNGGAIYTACGTYTGSSTDVFKNNTADNQGGAVYASYVEDADKNKIGATITMNGGIFENNTAYAGGAISARSNCTVNLNGTELKDNTSTCPQNELLGGGAIFMSYGNLTLSDASLDGNTTPYYGGALYVQGSVVDIKENTEFKNNVGATGTAMYFSNGSTVTMNTVSVTDNTASSAGVIYSNAGTIEMTDVTASGNKSHNGGVLYLSGDVKVTVNDGTYTGNSASNLGGVIHCRTSGGVTVNGGTYTGNTALSGGAFCADTNSSLTINNAVISENESTFVNPDSSGTYNSQMGGGAVSITGGSLTVSGTSFSKNKSVYYGGTIHAMGSAVTIKDNTTVSESTGKTGSALYLRDSSVTTIENSSILNNKNAGSGVIFLNSGSLDMTNVTASGNSAANGGVVNISDGKLKLTNVTATGNTASAGGVVLATGANTTVEVAGGTFSGNSVPSGSGGVIYNKEATLTIDGVVMTGNTANYGGAIYNTTAGKMVINNSSFSGNSATKNGGAISVAGGSLTCNGTNEFKQNLASNEGGAIYVSYIVNEDETTDAGTLTMNGGVFENNTAYAGGAVSAKTGTSSTFVGTVFKNNTATCPQSGGLGGGAIIANAGTLSISGATFEGNSAEYYGGAISARGETVEIKDNTIFKNNVGVTGTALHLRDGGVATLNNVSFTGHTHQAGNGTVYITGDGTLNMTDVTATGNENGNGGILYASGAAKVNFTGGTYTGNKAYANGGVIDYRASGGLTISGGTYSGNTAVKGGALHVSGATTSATVKDKAQFNNNTATNGGAVYADAGAAVTIEDSTLDGNQSSGDGGAIVVADTSKANAKTKLNISNATLQNNTSAARGGAIATATNSAGVIINATNCTFYKNMSTTSGGAVCVQCVNCASANDPTTIPIVFTNCTFTENKANSDGGALDVRTSSVVKIDGITATGNAARDRGGVAYVTSNFSRLYLSGTVMANNNTAPVSGVFVHLYDSGAYSNPPKIYTTHSSTEDWVKGVVCDNGKDTNIIFNMTTLP